MGNTGNIELKTGKDKNIGQKAVFITPKHSIDFGDEGAAQKSAFDLSAQKLFVGMEGVDTVAVYDVINLLEPKYLQWLNTNRTDIENGDTTPDGLLFILSDEKDPTGKSLLVVSNEVSGNVVVYSN